VSYDIPSDETRRKVATVLKDYGTRVQYSVFECILEKDKIEEMIKKVVKLIDTEEDSVRVYHLCDGCLKKVTVHGTGVLTHDEDVYVVG